jgi:hypothetical protein
MVQFRIASLELRVDADRPDVVEALSADWQGFASTGGPPDLHLRYEGLDGHLVPQPNGRAYPGYATTEKADTHLVLERRDGRLTVQFAPDGTVRGHLVGLAAPWALEAAMRALYSFALPRRGGLLLHSAGLRWPGADRAVVCLGPSGAGKSTLSQLLQGNAGCLRLGDDMTAVLPGETGFVAHATPFAGELGPAPDGCAPLHALYFLVKGSRHHLTPLPRREAIGRLLRNVVGFVDEPVSAAHALAAAEALAGAAPTGILEFARDPGIVELLAPPTLPYPEGGPCPEPPSTGSTRAQPGA